MDLASSVSRWIHCSNAVAPAEARRRFVKDGGLRRVSAHGNGKAGGPCGEGNPFTEQGLTS